MSSCPTSVTRIVEIWATAVLLLAVGAFSGCGSSEVDVGPTGTVTIKITYGGTPVTEGSVRIVVPNSAKGGYEPLDETGTATFDDVQTGTYTVAIEPPAPIDPDPEKPTPLQEFPNLPRTYREEATSSLRAEVKEGDNEFVFDLKK